MTRLSLATLALAVLALLADAGTAEARHRRLGMHAWCRADAAQTMGISRRAVALERHAVRVEGGRRILRGVAGHGRHGTRAFACHFDARGVLQGAV